MSKETRIGQLVIDLKIKTEALEKGLNVAKQKLQQLEAQNKSVKNSNSQLDASFIAMSAGIVASLARIKSAVDEGVEKYNTYKNSMQALSKTAKTTNNSMNDVKKSMEDVNQYKLLDEADLMKSEQNLLNYGFTVKQTTDILKVLQDSAVGNRQANYGFSESIRVTTEGIRMENSVLSDAAGIQKNIAKMYEEYAKSINKTTNDLTQAEKAQAVYNGIMDEAATFTGSAAEMAKGYQGIQAQSTAANQEFSRALGESMIPTLSQYNSLQLQITKGLTEFISNNKWATSGIITFTTTLLGTVVALTAVKKAYVSYKAAAAAADVTTKAFTVSLMSNPITLIAVALAAVVAGISVFNTKMQESIDKMNEATEASKTFTEALNRTLDNNGIIQEGDKETIENAKKEAEEIIATHKAKKDKIEEIEKQIQELKSKGEWNRSYNEDVELQNLEKEYKKLTKDMDKYEKQLSKQNKSVEVCKNKLNTYNKIISKSNTLQEYLNNTNTKAHRESLVNIAQTKADIKGKQQLLDILKKGKTETQEYADAKSQLVKIYPELAKVNENTLNSTQATIDEENRLAETEWALAQATIMNTIAELQAMQANDAKVQEIASATKQKVDDVKASIQAATNSLIEMSKLTPADFSGSITSSYTPKKSSSGGGGSYSNKKLDNYKKEIAHKKALDQLSLQEEISMYEYALKKYAKTADEKNEIREKIYELNKELAQKEKELLDQQTEDYEAYIQEQKNLRGSAYDITEQTSDYNKIIKTHKNYLNQIMKDERLSLDERKAIYREELQIIRDYEQKKRDLRVENIDNTVTQLTNAITKQLEEMQEKDKKFIDTQIENIEKLKEIRINAINAEYDARIEAIEKELEALDKAEQQKSRDEEDAEYERKKKRLEDLVAFEHDAVTKANYQKELNKLIAEYQKTLDSRALEDKKEALDAQKDLLQEEQDSKIEAIEEESEKQREVYNKQLEDLDEYYSKQIDMAQETAEKMLVNVQQNQDNILNLLKNYGNAYEITGQTLGEKLAQGINEGISNKIENIIQRIQDTIDTGIENKIAQFSSSAYRYEAGDNKPKATSINVTQNNYIEQNPEMPSETYRKLRDIDEQLASSLAGA